MILEEKADLKKISKIIIAAEKTLDDSPQLCVAGCRIGLEMILKWVYKKEKFIWRNKDKLNYLLSKKNFKKICGEDLLKSLYQLKKLGNHASHGNDEIRYEDALMCLQILYDFLRFLDCRYRTDFIKSSFEIT